MFARFDCNCKRPRRSRGDDAIVTWPLPPHEYSAQRKARDRDSDRCGKSGQPARVPLPAVDERSVANDWQRLAPFRFRCSTLADHDRPLRWGAGGGTLALRPVRRQKR